MSIFHWNPIRRKPEGVTEHTDIDHLPIIFVPRHYVRQRKRGLYNNLLILLGGLWALNVSHEMDTFDSDAREKLKNVLGTSGLFVSHLVAVPLIIRKLRLHYSIVLGAIGMSVTPFFYYLRNPVALSVVICLRIVFAALFDVSATIYATKLARICSRIGGNALFFEILAIRGYATIFGCTANLATFAWRRYVQETEIREIGEAWGASSCARKLWRKTRLAGTLSAGQSTILIAVAIVVALSGVLLIAMYLKPIGTLGDADITDEPAFSSPYRILKQFAKPRTIRLAVLITSCVFVHGINKQFLLTYVTCSFTLDYSFLIGSMKEFSIMFGAMSCVTIIDFTGFYWLYGIAVFCQMSCCACLLTWHLNASESQLSHMIIYHLLFASASAETSMLQLLVVQTLGSDETSAWCFYYVITDASSILRNVIDLYLCNVVKLCLVIAIAPIAALALATYSYGFCENADLREHNSLFIKTPRHNLTKPGTFDLKIVVEDSQSISKLETLLERRFTLASRRLIPPPSDMVSEMMLDIEDR